MLTHSLAGNHSNYCSRKMKLNVIVRQLLQHLQINYLAVIEFDAFTHKTVIKLCPHCEYSLLGSSRFQCPALSCFHACFFVDLIVVKVSF